MTGGARVPQERMSIFPARTLLQIKLASLIENEDVDGAMTQVIPMHFGTGCVAQNRLRDAGKKRLAKLCADIGRDGAIARTTSEIRNHEWTAKLKDGVRPLFVTATATAI